VDKDKVMAHQLQDIENKKLLEKKGYSVGEEEKKMHETESAKAKISEADEEMEEEEKLDYGDSQDKKTVQEGEKEDDYPESRDSFTTKVNKLTSGTGNRNAELIEVKLEKERNRKCVFYEEPRRCPILKNQEYADRTDLAMKRVPQKNEILCTDVLIPTVINCKDHVLVEMTEKLGVCSSAEGRHENIVSVIKHLEVARKNLFEENGKDKSMIGPSNTDLFSQVTEEVDDMAESSDEELVMHTSPSRVQLRKTSKN
jgi:hypothetical protein